MIGSSSLYFEFYDQNDNIFEIYDDVQTSSGDNAHENLFKKSYFHLKLKTNYNIIKIFI